MSNLTPPTAGAFFRLRGEGRWAGPPVLNGEGPGRARSCSGPRSMASSPCVLCRVHRDFGVGLDEPGAATPDSRESGKNRESDNPFIVWAPRGEGLGIGRASRGLTWLTGSLWLGQRFPKPRAKVRVLPGALAFCPAYGALLRPPQFVVEGPKAVLPQPLPQPRYKMVVRSGQNGPSTEGGGMSCSLDGAGTPRGDVAELV